MIRPRKGVLVSFINLILVVLYFPNSFGQSTKEFPLSNSIWSEKFQPPYYISATPVPIIHALFNEDTLIADKVFSKLYTLSDTVEVINNREYIGGIRCDSASRVFYFPSWGDQEYLIYNFEVEVGDTIFSNQWFNPEGYLVVSVIDSILVADQYRRMIHFEPYPEFPYSLTPWIEGIGSMRGLLFQSGDIPTNGIWGELVCFIQNKEVVFHNQEFDNCYPLPLSFDDNNLSYENQIRIFPNPSDNKVNFEFLQPDYLHSTIKIYGSDGGLIMETIVAESVVSIDVNGLARGIYFFICLNSEYEIKTGKFMVY